MTDGKGVLLCTCVPAFKLCLFVDAYAHLFWCTLTTVCTSMHTDNSVCIVVLPNIRYIVTSCPFSKKDKVKLILFSFQVTSFIRNPTKVSCVIDRFCVSWIYLNVKINFMWNIQHKCPICVTLGLNLECNLIWFGYVWVWMGNSIWIPHTPCKRFKKLLTGGMWILSR